MITQADADKQLKKFIPVLKLKEWDIELLVLDDASYQKLHGKDFAFDTNGCTEIDELSDKAVIYLKQSLDKEQMVETLRHECCHLVTHRYDTHVRKVVSMLDSKKLKKVLSEEGMWEMEINVSKLSTILKGLGVV